MCWFLAFTVGLGWLGMLPSLASNRGLSEGAVASLVSLVALANGLSRPFLGAWADRAGRFSVLLGATAMGIVGVLLPVVMEDTAVVWVTGVLVGVAFGGWLVNMPPVCAEALGGQQLGRTYGWLFTSYGAGALLGPLGLAWLRSIRPDDAYGLIASAAVLVFAAVGFVRLGAELKASPSTRATS